MTDLLNLGNAPTLVALVASLVGVLAAALAVYSTARRTRYDAEVQRVKLDALRASLEAQMYRLSDQLIASEERWRDVNHLLISTQSRQPEVAAPSRTVPYTPLLEASGIKKSDLTVRQDLVFVLTPFHEQYADTYDAISRTCTELGLRALRGDEEYVTGDLFPHILRLIVQARVIIANVDGRNPNVFYELGLAQALGKVSILIAHASDIVPFDIRTKKIILYHSYEDLQQRLRVELARTLAFEQQVPTM